MQKETTQTSGEVPTTGVSTQEGGEATSTVGRQGGADTASGRVQLMVRSQSALSVAKEFAKMAKEAHEKKKVSLGRVYATTCANKLYEYAEAQEVLDRTASVALELGI